MVNIPFACYMLGEIAPVRMTSNMPRSFDKNKLTPALRKTGIDSRLVHSKMALPTLL